MKWEYIKNQYLKEHLSKPLVDPKRRINALQKIEEILQQQYLELKHNPKLIINYPKNEFYELIRESKPSKKISAADKSVINGIYKILINDA